MSGKGPVVVISRKEIRKAEKRTRPKKRTVSDILTLFNAKLREKELSGGVVAIITRSEDGKIRCYGRRLSDGVIFKTLNLPIGKWGRIAFPTKIPKALARTRGYFVPGSDFGLAEKTWVVLVNITCEPCFGAIRFS